MKISILIPVKDRTKYLAQSIGSIAQCLPELANRCDYELILGDNCSEDRNIGVVARGFCPQIQVIRHRKDLGIFGNMNALLKASSGDWIHFCHDDDWILPGFYTRWLKALEESPEAGVVSILPRVVHEDKGGAVTPMPRWFDRTGIHRPEQLLAHLYQGTCFCIIGMLVKRSAYDQVGRFNETLPHSADWEMWKRLAASGVPWYYCQESLCRYRNHEGTMTARYLTDGTVAENIARTIAQDKVPHQLAEIHRAASLTWAAAMASDAKTYIGEDNAFMARHCLEAARAIIDTVAPTPRI